MCTPLQDRWYHAYIGVVGHLLPLPPAQGHPPEIGHPTAPGPLINEPIGRVAIDNAHRAFELLCSAHSTSHYYPESRGIIHIITLVSYLGPRQCFEAPILQTCDSMTIAPTMKSNRGGSTLAEETSAFLLNGTLRFSRRMSISMCNIAPRFPKSMDVSGRSIVDDKSRCSVYCAIRTHGHHSTWGISHRTLVTISL